MVCLRRLFLLGTALEFFAVFCRGRVPPLAELTKEIGAAFTENIDSLLEFWRLQFAMQSALAGSSHVRKD